MTGKNPQHPPIRLILVSKIHLYREGLALLLANDDRLEVLATFERGRDAIAGVGELEPDCVLLDMASQEEDDTALAICASCPDTKIVAIGVSERDVVACAECGVSGFVLRAGSTEELVRAVEAAMAEELLCSQRIAAALLRRVGGLAARRPSNPEVRLTPRESEIVALIDQGLTNKEIAVRLVIEVATVKNHVHNVLEKLSASTRGEAAARVRSWQARRGAPFGIPLSDPHLRA